ncbi:GLPGLI family protein [Jejuia pallidilutea]|uniref:GLPGLI family protein n=1 Tax=Jejuia pallidilutea TaxID=504487 RepID=A0A362WWJ8_9FLAO|nr:GLPGLI family protein [Jejuia pallidilutea]PQV44591.1 GLPGLI family protein [Jejuia pallidilutea]
MKNLILYFFLFLGASIYSQNNSGIVIYKAIKKETSTDKISDKDYKAFSEKLEKSAVQLEFKLQFNKHYSLFALKDGLTIDKNDFNSQMAIMLLRGNNVYFTDKKLNALYENTDFLSQKFSIKYKFEDLDWVITKDTKIIEGYKCYKAYYNRPFYDRNGDKKYGTVLAWFTQDISSSAGPFEAVGLPGLVLEFHSGKYIFIAKEIYLKKDIKIEKPSMEKTISKAEFDNIQKEKYLDLKN